MASEEQDEILDAIKEQQNNIANKKKILLDIEHELEALAADIDDPRVKKLADGMSNLCIVLQNLYDHAEGQRIHYNFVKPHTGLEGKTPAENAGLDVKGWKKLIEQAISSKL
jgi:DNA gyrase/topoisomerase IV subunit A